MAQHVEEEFGHGVATLRLTRPPLNSFDDELRGQLSDAIRRIADSHQVAALVIVGDGKAFSAGADLKDLAEMQYEQIVGWNRALQRTFTEIAQLPVPVIAAVNGYALGGGMELALAADFRIVADSAQMGLPEVKLGIVPGAGGIQRLRRIVGSAIAKQLLMSGRRISSTEALDLGIAQEVVSRDGLLPRAQELAEELSSGPRFAIQAIKEAVDQMEDAPLSAGLAMDRSALAGLFGTEDRTIGMRSFLNEGPGKAKFGQKSPTN